MILDKRLLDQVNLKKKFTEIKYKEIDYPNANLLIGLLHSK